MNSFSFWKKCRVKRQENYITKIQYNIYIQSAFINIFICTVNYNIYNIGIIKMKGMPRQGRNLVVKKNCSGETVKSTIEITIPTFWYSRCSELS